MFDFPFSPPLRRKSLLEAGKQQMDNEVFRSRWKVTSDSKLLKKQQFYYCFTNQMVPFGNGGELIHMFDIV